MAVYVDELRKYKGLRWFSCHMMTDGNVDELHQMADKIGLKREWFQNNSQHPHYDLSRKYRYDAIQNGAIAVTSLEMIRKCSKRFSADKES